MNSKKWYKSKGMVAGVVALLIVVYNAAIPALAAGCGTDPVGLCVTVPVIPEFVYAILTALGLYGRASAKTTIN